MLQINVYLFVAGYYLERESRVVFRSTLTWLHPNTLTDLEHVLRGPLHHPDDGALLHLHWPHIQRLLLQVAQPLRLWVECESNVHGRGVEVSVAAQDCSLILMMTMMEASVLILFFLCCVLPTVTLFSKGTVISLLIQT